MTDELAKILAEVLSILAIATKGQKEGRLSRPVMCDKLPFAYILAETFVKKVVRINEIEDALQSFGALEQRELLTGLAQVSSDTSGLKDGV